MYYYKINFIILQNYLIVKIKLDKQIKNNKNNLTLTDSFCFL